MKPLRYPVPGCLVLACLAWWSVCAQAQTPKPSATANLPRSSATATASASTSTSTSTSVPVPVSVSDDLGRTVTLAKPARRIVSLLPSLTETVCALGQCSRLVGVDRWSNYPPEVSRLPQLGGGLDPQIEAIVALKPDLVLAASSSRAVERLRSLGLTVVALEPKTWAHMQRTTHILGQLLQVKEADQLWRSMDADLDAVARSLPAKARGLRVYFEASPTPHAAGEASFIGETLARLGAKNIVPVNMGAFPALNPEYIVRADPDLIMVGDSSATGMAGRPGWSRLRAIVGKHVCQFDPAQSDLLVRPGPRMAEGARAMAECLVRHMPSGQVP